MSQFDIPIVLFLFKRCNTVLHIINRVRCVQPRKVYLLADHGRNEEEKKIVNEYRKRIEQAIDWPCEIIKKYADENIGVHANIGLGARWIFEREDEAIFLEDDNLPEISFFQYCKEMLLRYSNDNRVLWVCGTNYLGKYEPTNHASYMFTQHMLPCGWASWAKKFNKYYDAELDLAYDSYVFDEIKYTYSNNKLYFQQRDSFLREKNRRDAGERFSSWDYHLALSIRANRMLGISPAYNQIMNIGVDDDSIHGGTTMNSIMTQRFCGMKSFELQFPLKHPKTIIEDHDYERKISKIILLPLRYRIKRNLSKIVKKAFKIPQEQSLRDALRIIGK